MKYHYQYVSPTSVRIELIPEDPKEILLLKESLETQEENPRLLALFAKGLNAYSEGSTFTQATFMNFPKVALCRFTKASKKIAQPT